MRSSLRACSSLHVVSQRAGGGARLVLAAGSRPSHEAGQPRAHRQHGGEGCGDQVGRHAGAAGVAADSRHGGLVPVLRCRLVDLPGGERLHYGSGYRRSGRWLRRPACCRARFHCVDPGRARRPSDAGLPRAGFSRRASAASEPRPLGMQLPRLTRARREPPTPFLPHQHHVPIIRVGGRRALPERTVGPVPSSPGA